MELTDAQKTKIKNMLHIHSLIDLIKMDTFAIIPKKPNVNAVALSLRIKVKGYIKPR